MNLYLSSESKSTKSTRQDTILISQTWRKVFVTQHGYLGMGPELLNVGDSVMVIPGAPVSFIFTRAEKGLQKQERSVLENLDKNNEKYAKVVCKKEVKSKSSMGGSLNPVLNIRRKRWEGKLKRLDREMLELERSLDAIRLDLGNVLQENGGEDVWVLMGEAHVEGIIHGEFVDRGSEPRIKII